MKENSNLILLTDMNHVLSSTPSFQSLSQAHRAHIRNSTSKSLLDEYNNTFSSTKTPMSEKRMTLNHIALDIIKQRVENINRNASFNRSMNDLHDDAGYDDLKNVTAYELETVPVATPPASAVRPIDTEATSNTGVLPLKPLKRKLFAPPSLFPEHSSIGLATPQKTDTKKTVNQKRKRNDVCATKNGVPLSSSTSSTSKLSKSDEKKKTTGKPRTNNNRKTMAHSRRSTMFFETPPSAAAAAKQATQSSTTATNSTANAIGTPSLVFTSMHQPQIDFITEVRQG